MLEFGLGIMTGILASMAGLYYGYKRFLTKLISRTISNIELPENEQVKILPRARLINYTENGFKHTAIMPFDFTKIMSSLGLKYRIYFGDQMEDIDLPVGQYIIGRPQDYGITKIELHNVLDNEITEIYNQEQTDDKSIWQLVEIYLEKH